MTTLQKELKNNVMLFCYYFITGGNDAVMGVFWDKTSGCAGVIENKTFQYELMIHFVFEKFEKSYIKKYI